MNKLTYDYFKTWLQTFTKTERGASLVEYALLVALIAVVCIGAVAMLGGTVDDTFTSIDEDLKNPPTSAP